MKKLNLNEFVSCKIKRTNEILGGTATGAGGHWSGPNDNVHVSWTSDTENDGLTTYHGYKREKVCE